MPIDLRSIKPHVVTTDMSGKSILLYGGVKTGKTTTACKFPKPLLLAFEKGYNMIPGVMAQPINSWAEVQQVQRQLIQLMREYEQGKVDEPMFKTIIVDTADLAWNQCEKFVSASLGITYLDESEWNAGYKRAEKVFADFFQAISRAGYTQVIISHEATKQVEDKLTGERRTRVQPSLEKKPMLVLTGLVDIVAHAENVPQEDGSVKMMLRMRGNDIVEAGSRNPYTSEFIPFTYDALSLDMTEAMNKLAENSGQELSNAPNNPYKIEEQESYEDLMEQVKQYAIQLKSAGLGEKYQLVLDKHLGVGKKAKDCTEAQIDVLCVIRDDLAAIIKELEEKVPA